VSRVRIAVLVALAALGGYIAYHRLSRPAPHTLPWQDVTASLPGLEPPRPASHVFRTRAAFAHYLDHVMPGSRIAVPPIDFSRHEAFFVTSGPRSSTGYSLRILRVVDHGGHVTVLVRELTPSLSTRVQPRVTYPYRLITIPRSRKTVFANFEGRP
jgi:hypothetical protein